MNERSTVAAGPATWRVAIDGTSVSFPCVEAGDVLGAMRSLGRTDIPVGCRSGGCGVCRVEVLGGDYACGKMSRARVTEEDERRGVVLSCRLHPRSDLRLRVAFRDTRDANSRRFRT